MAKGNARGIFKLKGVNEEQLSTPTNWTSLDDAWVIPDSHQVAFWDYGYYCSGNNNTRVDRLDYTADTEMTTRAYTYKSEYDDGGLSSPSSGYMWGTGNPSTNDSPGNYYQKLDYSNDAVVLTPGATLTATPGPFNKNYTQLAVGTESYGYTLYQNNLYRFDYSSDTSNWVEHKTSSTSQSANTGYGAVGNQSYSYWCVGPGSPEYTAIERLDYSSDTTAMTPKGPLAVGNRSHGFHAGNANYGWWAGGGPGFTGPNSDVQRIDYSSDTSTASVRGNLMTPACAGGGTGNRSGMWIARYFNSGYVQKIDYSQDLIAAANRFNHTNTWWATGFGAQNSAGTTSSGLTAAGNVIPYGYRTAYIGGGTTPSATTTATVSKINYAHDTNTTLTKGPLSSARKALSAGGGYDAAWFTGGENPGGSVQATVDKVDYANDTATATPKGGLSIARSWAATIGSESNAYVFGGSKPAATTTIDRIEYANDTNTTTAIAELPAARYGGGVTANNTYAWFGGGDSGGPVESTVDRLTFASDSSSPSPKGNLDVARKEFAATGNGTYGWFFGGTPGVGANIGRINYSNDTLVALARGSLATAAYENAVTGDANYGYSCGLNPASSIIQRLDYSNDGVNTLYKGHLVDATQGAAASSGQANGRSTKGTSVKPINHMNYTVGTHNNIYCGKPGRSDIIRIDMSNDSCTDLTNTLFTTGSTNNNHGKGSAGNANYGYWAGGGTNRRSTIDRIDYANEGLNILPRGFLADARENVASANNINYGYFMGGETPAGDVSTVSRLDYSNDSAVAATKGSMPGAVDNAGGIGNQNYGYLVGGSPDVYGGSQTERIDYSNDTPAASPKGDMTIKRMYAGGNSTADYGWIGGGSWPGPAYYSSVERMDFSNDTATFVLRGNLTTYQASKTTGGNSVFGYTFFGTNNTEMGQKIDYANDTQRAFVVTSTIDPSFVDSGSTSGSENGKLSIDARSQGAVRGFQVYHPLGPQRGYPQASYAYFQGGKAGNPGQPNQYGGTQGNKFNIESGTCTIVGTRSTYNPTNNTAMQVGATGNTNYSWWTAGTNPETSTIDRMEYANDNTATVPRSTISHSPVKRDIFATGNVNYGWYMAGSNGSTEYSDVERLDYSNDTAQASPKGSLLAPRAGGAAAGNQSYGYFAGGWDYSPAVYYSNIYRIDYSNDTPTATAKGPLAVARWGMGTSSHSASAYFVGGNNPSLSPSDIAYTRIDRLDFSNDTPTTSAKSAIPGPGKSYRFAGTGNGTYGVYGAGESGTNVFRLGYASDMVATEQKGPLLAPYGPSSSNNGNADAVCTGENGMQANTFTPVPFAATNYSWFAGGSNTMQRLDLSNDTETTLSSPLQGDASGGWPGGAATGNSSYGYWAGGWPGTDTWRHSTKVDYSNGFVGMSHDTGILVVSMYFRGAATGNANYGYWCGGWNLSGPHAPSWPSTLVSRLDYSSDTDDMVDRADMNQGRSYFDATGNQSYGYWAMGDNSGGTKVERLDYSSDTTFSTKGDLVAGGSYAVCSGNADYGYWTYSNDTKLQRVDYSNDTAAGTEKGPLTIGHPGGQGSGNNSYGYFAGGQGSSQPNWSQIDRLDYSSDTTTAIVKGYLGTNLPSYCGDGVGAADYALPQ